MKGVGFSGTPFKDEHGKPMPRDPQDDTKQWALSPENFYEFCYVCGVKFRENESDAILRVHEGKLTGQRRHRRCKEPKG